MEVFYITIQIVFGVLMPVIIVLSICATVYIGRSLPHALELMVEKIKKRPPYDEVLIQDLIAEKDYYIEFTKNGEVVWAGKLSETKAKGITKRGDKE